MRSVALGRSRNKYTALQAAQACGQTANLHWCLDAGDAASYDGSSQTLTDVSGSGINFYRGTTSGADSTDPTFSGTSGNLSSNEYFSSDAGDFFTKASANSTAINNMHKNNAAWTVITAFYHDVTAENSLFGDNGSFNTGTGVQFQSRTTGAGANTLFRVFVDNVKIIEQGATILKTSNAWEICAISVDEASAFGLIRSLHAETTFSSTYSSTSTTDATYTMNIGARGNGYLPMTSTQRIAISMMWDRSLNSGECGAVMNMLRPRFNL